MTEPDAAAPTSTQLDRIAKLRAQRAGADASSDPPTQRQPTAALPTSPRSTRRPKRHAARRSRIVAAGLGAATMVGIVGALGLDHSFTAAGSGSAVPASAQVPTPIRVVVHRTPAPVDAVASGAAGSENPSTAVPAGSRGTTEPIVLTANPVVRNVTVAAPAPASAPAPAATTRGSR